MMESTLCSKNCLDLYQAHKLFLIHLVLSEGALIVMGSFCLRIKPLYYGSSLQSCDTTKPLHNSSLCLSVQLYLLSDNHIRAIATSLVSLVSTRPLFLLTCGLLAWHCWLTSLLSHPTQGPHETCKMAANCAKRLFQVFLLFVLPTRHNHASFIYKRCGLWD